MRVIESDRFRGPTAASRGGGGNDGGSVDDILKRLGALEVSVGGILATLPRLATKADLAKLEGSLGGELARVEGSLGKAIAKLEGSLVKWMVGTIISAVAAAFAVAKFLS
jgi:hypothetical protein